MCGFFGAWTYAMKMKNLVGLERQAQSVELKGNSTQVLFDPYQLQ